VVAMPLWVQVAYAVFLAALIPLYWWRYGPGNFLWFSDIALFLAGVSLYTGEPLPASMAAVAVLVLEVLWNVDFFGHLLTGRRFIGLADYMFDGRPLWLRALSLFHVPLPILIVFLVQRLGYDTRGLLAQTALTWVVLPATYLLTKPEPNVNWVYGPGATPQRWMHPYAYVALLMVAIPVVGYVPTHFLLKWLFPAA
jgi:hypothetical protein